LINMRYQPVDDRASHGMLEEIDQRDSGFFLTSDTSVKPWF